MRRRLVGKDTGTAWHSKEEIERWEKASGVKRHVLDKSKPGPPPLPDGLGEWEKWKTEDRAAGVLGGDPSLRQRQKEKWMEGCEGWNEVCLLQCGLAIPEPTCHPVLRFWRPWEIDEVTGIADPLTMNGSTWSVRWVDRYCKAHDGHTKLEQLGTKEV